MDVINYTIFNCHLSFSVHNLLQSICNVIKKLLRLIKIVFPNTINNLTWDENSLRKKKITAINLTTLILNLKQLN